MFQRNAIVKAALDNGKVVLINTAKGVLKPVAPLMFGRYMIVPIMQATLQRAAQEQRDRRRQASVSSLDALIALLDRPDRKLLKRLAALTTPTLTDRVRSSTIMPTRAARRSFTPSATRVPRSSPNWTARRAQREIGRTRTGRRGAFIARTLKIADFMTARESAVRCRSDVQLIEAQNILAAAPAETRRAHSKWKLPASMSLAGATHDIGSSPTKCSG
jgi:hypothetical protein